MTHSPNTPHPQPWAVATDALADEITTVVPPRLPSPQGNPRVPSSSPTPWHYENRSRGQLASPGIGAYPFVAAPQPTEQRAPWAPPPGHPITYPGVYPASPYQRSRTAFRMRGRTTLLAGAAALLVAVIVMVVGVTAGGWFGSTQLNITAAQSTVSTLLGDPANGFGTTISDVTCNHGHNPTVAKGATFTCTATIDGVPRELTATFTDDNGNYDLSAPH